MDAVTYPNETVINFMNNDVISLRIPSDQEPFATDFKVKWTPTLLILDQNGKEHNRVVGFLGEEELVPSILLGIGNAYFNTDLFQKALACYDKIVNQHPNSDSAPEAIFQTGVSRYKNSDDPMPLKEAYEKLSKEYPDSQWAKRAYPYRLI